MADNEGVDVTKVNAEKYELGRQAVADGRWRVDPDAGLLYGQRGIPLGEKSWTGYLVASLHRPGRCGARLYVHRVIWESQYGEVPPVLVVNHINGTKDDNRIQNLEVVTPQQNVRHAHATGLHTGHAETHQYAKLTNDQVREIYRRVWAGEVQQKLSAEFGIAVTGITKIKHGASWISVTNHVPSAELPVSKHTYKLSADDVRESYRLATVEHVPDREIAARMKINHVMVWRIRTGKSWASITGAGEAA